jgi:hypothetical protein
MRPQGRRPWGKVLADTDNRTDGSPAAALRNWIKFCLARAGSMTPAASAEGMASDMGDTASPPIAPPNPNLAMPVIRIAGVASAQKSGSVITLVLCK